MSPPRSIAIAARLAAMFAMAALLVLSLLGYALDRELATVLRRQQIEQLDTKFRDIDYVIERLRGPEQWERIHAKLDALTPPDRSTQYWILSDDPQIRYGNAMAEIVGFSQGASSVGELRVGDRPEPMLIRSAYFPAERASRSAALHRRHRFGVVCAHAPRFPLGPAGQRFGRRAAVCADRLPDHATGAWCR